MKAIMGGRYSAITGKEKIISARFRVHKRFGGIRDSPEYPAGYGRGITGQ
jgi:hypothetical protein